MRQTYCMNGVTSSLADSVEDRQLAGLHDIFITNALHGLRAAAEPRR